MDGIRDWLERVGRNDDRSVDLVWSATDRDVLVSVDGHRMILEDWRDFIMCDPDSPTGAVVLLNEAGETAVVREIEGPVPGLRYSFTGEFELEEARLRNQLQEDGTAILRWSLAESSSVSIFLETRYDRLIRLPLDRLVPDLSSRSGAKLRLDDVEEPVVVRSIKRLGLDLGTRYRLADGVLQEIE